MSRLILIAVFAWGVLLAGCSDTFNPPELPDLKKTPYDFAIVVPPFTDDMHIGDMGGVTD